jgi:Asp-tRNA(Asn)/Glu-tRNA(Gln) amidotransferase A subunit family amidase
LRPASFCGVVGFKPTFGVLPLEGVMPFAPTLDTLGFFTQTSLDMRLLWRLLGNPVPDYSPLTYGMVEFPVDPDMQETFRHSIQILGHYGAQIRRVTLPESFHRMAAAVPLIQNYEGARTHRDKHEKHGSAIGAKLTQLIREGLATSDETYAEALRALDAARADMAPIFADFPVLLSPAAVGPPPQGLASTGDPRCNAPWTGLHVPAIAIPMPAGEQLPMGLQMAAAHSADALLLATAAHCQALLEAGGPQT